MTIPGVASKLLLSGADDLDFFGVVANVGFKNEVMQRGPRITKSRVNIFEMPTWRAGNPLFNPPFSDISPPHGIFLQVSNFDQIATGPLV